MSMAALFDLLDSVARKHPQLVFQGLLESRWRTLITDRMRGGVVTDRELAEVKLAMLLIGTRDDGTEKGGDKR